MWRPLRLLGLVGLLLPTLAWAQGTVRLAPIQGSGTITASGGIVSLPVLSTANGAIQLTGTWVGTLQLEGTLDGVTWLALKATPLAGGADVTATTVNGAWTVAAPLTTVRVRASAWTSGTATVTLLFTTARAGGGGGGTTGLTHPEVMSRASLRF